MDILDSQEAEFGTSTTQETEQEDLPSPPEANFQLNEPEPQEINEPEQIQIPKLAQPPKRPPPRPPRRSLEISNDSIEDFHQDNIDHTLDHTITQADSPWQIMVDDDQDHSFFESRSDSEEEFFDQPESVSHSSLYTSESTPEPIIQPISRTNTPSQISAPQGWVTFDSFPVIKVEAKPLDSLTQSQSDIQVEQQNSYTRPPNRPPPVPPKRLSLNINVESNPSKDLLEIEETQNLELEQETQDGGLLENDPQEDSLLDDDDSFCENQSQSSEIDSAYISQSKKPRPAPPPRPARASMQIEPSESLEECEPLDFTSSDPQSENLPEEKPDRIIREAELLKKSSSMGVFQKRWVQLYRWRMVYYKKKPVSGQTSACEEILLEDFKIHKIQSRDTLNILLWMEPRDAKICRDFIWDHSDKQELHSWYLDIKSRVTKLEAKKPGESSARTLTRSTSKKRLGGAPRSSGIKPIAAPVRHVFGIPLERVTECDPSTNIPNFVLDTISYLRAHVKVEGLFRESGSSLAIGELHKKLDAGEVVDFDEILDPHTVTGLLKLFLREMTPPLCPWELYDDFMGFPTIPEEGRVAFLADLIGKLPPREKATLKFITEFLLIVNHFEEENRMSKTNIAIVISPNVFRKKSTAIDGSDLKDTQVAIQLFAFYLEHYREIVNPDQ